MAWTIAGAERVCGSTEACIRAPAPIFYFGTSLLVYAVARQFHDAQVAFYCAVSLALATGCVFSARIISTDVPLLFFWTLALLAYVKLLSGADSRWGLVLGVALGLGLMAKYAMLYFVLGVALAAWFDADARTPDEPVGHVYDGTELRHRGVAVVLADRLSERSRIRPAFGELGAELRMREPGRDALSRNVGFDDFERTGRLVTVEVPVERNLVADLGLALVDPGVG